MKIHMEYKDGIYSAALFTIYKGEMILFTHSFEMQPDISREYQDAMFQAMAYGALENEYPELYADICNLPEYKRYDNKSERDYYDNYS